MDSNNDIPINERDIQASALLDGFTLPEMEEVIETNIFELMGVDKNLSDDQRNDLMRVFQDTLQSRVTSRILDQLNEDERKKFIELAEKDPEGAEKFLNDKGINKEQITVAEIILYKLELAQKRPK